MLYPLSYEGASASLPDGGVVSSEPILAALLPDTAELTEDDDPMTASLPSGARSASFEADKLKAERAGRLTDLQEIITAAVVAKNAVGDDPLAAEIAEMTGYNVFVVSGALSSLVEKGYLRTRKVAGKACYFRTSNA